jgi:hypothetical protein
LIIVLYKNMKPRPNSLGFLLHMNSIDMTIEQNNIWFGHSCSQESYVQLAMSFPLNPDDILTRQQDCVLRT